MRPVLWMILARLVATPGFAAKLAPAQIENRRRFNCHGQEGIAKIGSQDRLTMVDRSAGVGGAGPASAPARRGGLFVTAQTLAGTVHVNLACTDCHAAAKALPHPAKLGPAIRRFTGVDRLNHGLMATSFFGLTLTGLSLL